MDFFEAQDQARRSTGKLVILFALAVLGIVVALNGVALGAMYFLDRNSQSSTRYDANVGREVEVGGGDTFNWFRPGLAALVTLGTVVLVGGASAFKTAQLHGDGGKVASMLGGRKLDPTTDDPEERKLLNIVEEMSIASGVPVPDCYVMDREMGINAFAAGSSIDEAVVGVTRGTIEKLSRDELQGVIAHEFSHILNGDMKINLRLIGVIFGILVIGLLGYTIFRYAPYLMSSRGSSNNKNNGAAFGIALFVVGALVWLIGSIGVFFGRLIQASISRQREYLADASAVQFTRNPNGIRDALRKIGGSSFHGTLHTPHAGECSHLFFADGFKSLFATHPPLPERIKAIDGTWNGTMLKAEMVSDRQRVEHESGQRRQRPKSVFGPLGDILGTATAGTVGGGGGGATNPIASMLGSVAGAAMAADVSETVAQRGGRASKAGGMRSSDLAGRVGQLDEKHIEFAGLMTKAIPDQLRQAVRRPDLARGVVAALFLSDDRSVRTLQADTLAQQDPEAAQAADALAEIVDRLGPAGRLPLVELAAPALRSLDANRGGRFLGMLRALAEADGTVEPFEYAIYKLVSRLVTRSRPREKYAELDHVAEAAQTLLSGLALAGHPKGGKAAMAAYKQGAAKLQRGDLAYRGDFRLAEFDTGLDRLAEAQMPVKRRVLEAASATVAADGVVTVEEAELLRAVSAVLQCPLPPFIDAARG